MKEQRNFSRIKFPAHCKLEIAGHPHGAELLDISLRGALVRTTEPLPLTIGEQALIKVFLPESSISLNFSSLLVHQDREKNNYGFKFISYDAESMTHLRRILEYNLEDHEKAIRELFFLLDN
ncbi:MAG: PilZ domain-containing protein [Deltaproteobacteria bacterium]|nr:PilZ domain-containing protein [Deltaproteobacteria bacterium]